MDKEEIQEIVKDIIKNNLKIVVETSTEDYYARRKDTVKVSLWLDDELILITEDSL